MVCSLISFISSILNSAAILPIQPWKYNDSLISLISSILNSAAIIPIQPWKYNGLISNILNISHHELCSHPTNPTLNFQPKRGWKKFLKKYVGKQRADQKGLRIEFGPWLPIIQKINTFGLSKFHHTLLPCLTELYLCNVCSSKNKLSESEFNEFKLRFKSPQKPVSIERWLKSWKLNTIHIWAAAQIL